MAHLTLKSTPCCRWLPKCWKCCIDCLLLTSLNVYCLFLVSVWYSTQDTLIICYVKRNMNVAYCIDASTCRPRHRWSVYTGLYAYPITHMLQFIPSACVTELIKWLELITGKTFRIWPMTTTNTTVYGLIHMMSPVTLLLHRRLSLLFSLSFLI